MKYLPFGLLIAFLAAQYGYQQGYARGVRDIGSLVMVLHEAERNMPEDEPDREIVWRRR